MSSSHYETAKENDLDPYQYLLWLLQNAPGLSETDEAWAEKLLPASAPEECYMPQKYMTAISVSKSSLRWRPFIRG